MNFLTNLTHSTAGVLTLVVVVETLIIVFLMARTIRVRAHLIRAEKYASDSAKAASLAVPGGIDSEVVMKLLRTGKPVTVDTVFEAMEQRERSQQQ